MTKINVLDKHLAQLIAAGEVVERPASVVKELLENSIDAKATRITVEIKNGGVKLIKVSDNGTGIFRDDVKNAFLRHATSKLKTQDDLERIGSLGFRGEALASICAVSQVDLITKSQNEKIGTKFSIDAGVPGKIEDIGCADGTTFYIKNLFYNTPARMKFLKKDVAEAGACAAVVDKLALSHPEISFKFIKDGKQTLHTPGDGKIESAIYSVYGKEFYESLMPIEYKYENITVSGFVSKPICAKATRTMQSFFINGRYIKSRAISQALEEAFKNSVMVGKFPYGVLYLDIPLNSVDVNVHPTKTEVKFSNEKLIFEAVYYAAKTVLMNINNKIAGAKIEIDNFVANDVSKNSEPLNNLPFKPIVHKVFSDYKNSPIAKVLNASTEVKPVDLPQAFKDEHNNDFKIESKSDVSSQIVTEPEYLLASADKSGALAVKISEKSTINSFEKNEEAAQIDFLPQEKPLKIVGEVFNCYIIIEYDGEIVFVDKHAAHERIIFEKLKQKVSVGDAQSLLEPIVMTFEKEEYTALLENAELLANVGYEIEDFGQGSVIVRSVPMYIDVDQIKDAVNEIASYVVSNKREIVSKKLDWLYHNIACRSAVKGGNISSFEEITALVKDLISNPDIQYCPHGRPIFISFTKYQIEKKFGRV